MAQKGPDTALNKTAESIGTTLGNIHAKYDAWMKQRDIIASELKDYIAAAQKMVAEMGHTADVAVAQAKVAVNEAVATGKRAMSAEARQKISEGAKARWAARRAKAEEAAEVVEGGPAKRTVSPDVRARLSKLAKARWAKARKAGKTKL